MPFIALFVLFILTYVIKFISAILTYHDGTKLRKK